MKHTKTPKNVQHTSIGRTVPKEFVKTEFAKLVRKGDSGGNDYVADFLLAMDDLTESKGSFNYSDALFFLKRFAIPNYEAARLWEKWTQFNIGWRRLSVVESCYSEPLYVIQSV